MDTNSWALGLIMLLLAILVWRSGCRCQAGRSWMLEKKVDSILKHLNIEVDLSPVDREILDLLKAGKKIEAIKLYRARSGSGLKEAKDYVEQLQG